jgi:carbamate kinase
VLCLITQTLVDGRDPAFRRPTKPVGPSYDRPTAQAIAHRTGYVFQIMPDRRWRRVVASPRPLGFVEEPILRAVVDAGHIVIAAGGGGVPVVAHGPTLRGVEAVVDKDLAAARLAVIVGADVLLILTAVSRVQIGYGTAEAQEVEDLTVAAASDYLQQGQFPAGSMGPKVQACIDFARTGGKSIIAALTDAGAALAGTAGTRIHA